jgi:hypothetical protein
LDVYSPSSQEWTNISIIAAVAGIGRVVSKLALAKIWSQRKKHLYIIIQDHKRKQNSTHVVLTLLLTGRLTRDYNPIHPECSGL